MGGQKAASNMAAAFFPGPEIDVVFTWVDGADPAWLAAKRALQRKLFGGPGSGDGGAEQIRDDADNAARFRDNDELRYALRSLALHAPWVRKVHLVTADQKPAWLNDRAVNLVSHRDIFPADVPLPVFSTRPIEFCVHRVPGLAEHFIYCNDDFMLGRAVRPEEFFRPDGRPLLWVVKRGEKYMRKVRAKLKDPSSHASAVARAHKLIADRYGESFPYLVRHYPRSMVRSSAAALWDAFPEAVRATLNAPFRSPSDVSVTALYPLFLLTEELGEAKIINGPRQILDVLTGKGPAYMGASLGEENTLRKMRGIRLLRPRAFCINDAPGASVTNREALRAFLDGMFPDPCKYELPEKQGNTKFFREP